MEYLASVFATLWALARAFKIPLVLFVVFSGPRLFARAVALVRGSPDVPSVPRPRVLVVAASAAVAWAAWSIAMPGYNAFADRSLLTPTEVLRPLVLADFGLRDASDDARIDLLLTRLGTLDGRVAYARWGHDAVASCAWCSPRAPTDFMLSALPALLAPYVAHAALIGVMGWSVCGFGATARARHWRPTAAWAIAVLATAEIAARTSLDLRAKQNYIPNISPLLDTVRAAALAAITALYVFLSVRPSPAAAAEVRLVRTLDNAYNTLRLTDAARTAIARSPAMARTAAAHRAARDRAADRARKHPDVRDAARAAGTIDAAGVDRGEPIAREYIREQWARVVPDTTVTKP